MRRPVLAELNEQYSQLKLPTWCLSEGRKIKNKISPMQYHLVKPESAIQDFCTVKRHFEDKNHYEMVAVKGKMTQQLKL